jgi:hypothetical protein
MRLGLLRWVVLFFTRPVRLSDFAGILRMFKGRPKSIAEKVAVVSERVSEPPRMQAESRATRVSRPAPRESPQGVDVSEQPLDTLPDDLRIELLVPAANSGAPDPSSPGGAREPTGR